MIRQANLNAAHNVTSNFAVLLRHNEGFREPLIQIHKEIVCIVLRQANAVNLHYALQVVGREFAQFEGLLHLFAFRKRDAQTKLKVYVSTMPSADLNSGKTKLP